MDDEEAKLPLPLFISKLLHYVALNHSAPLCILTFEARLSFFMACIIPRRPWQPEASLLEGPAAGELSCDATSELGTMLMLSGVEALSSMLGSAPFRQLKVFRLLWGGGGFNSVEGAKKKKKGSRRVNGNMFVYASRILFNWAVREPSFIGMYSTVPRVEMNKCTNLFGVPCWFNLRVFKGWWRDLNIRRGKT